MLGDVLALALAGSRVGGPPRPAVHIVLASCYAQDVAGELLFRILDRRAFEELVRRAPPGNLRKCFFDRGQWSLLKPTGQHYVVIDGPWFFEEAPYLYEGHHTFEELPLPQAETATLLVPSETVTSWRPALQALPARGQVGGRAPEVRDALVRMMDTVIARSDLGLTVESLL